MAKKYKRTVTAAQARPDAAAVDETATAERPAVMFSRRAGVNDFNPDYTYVANDLKRIGIMSGIFVVILVIMSFILPSLKF
jgi:hypothetical protein